MNKEHNSYEDESPLSYDNYAARQLLEDYKRRKEDILKPAEEAEGLLEALMWCIAVFTIMLVGAIVLTLG